MNDKELIKLAYAMGYQVGMEKSAQFVQGLRNVRDAAAGARGNDAYGRLIQLVKGVGQTGLGFGRGVGRFGKELGKGVRRGYQDGSVSKGIVQGLKGGLGQIQHGLGAAGRFLDRNMNRVKAVQDHPGGPAEALADKIRQRVLVATKDNPDLMAAWNRGEQRGRKWGKKIDDLMNKIRQGAIDIKDLTKQEWARY